MLNKDFLNVFLRFAALLGAFLLSLAKSAYAAHSPYFQGTGCNANNTSISISPDQRYISVLYSGMNVEAGGSSGVTTSTKSCTLYVPIQLNYLATASHLQVDYRGFDSLPSGASRNLLSKVSIRNSSQQFFSQLTSQNFLQNGNANGNFLHTQIRDFNLSKCSKLHWIKIETQLTVQTNGLQQFAVTGLDSTDTDTTVSGNYGINFYPCAYTMRRLSPI